jgi:cytidine deaminase
VNGALAFPCSLSLAFSVPCWRTPMTSPRQGLTSVQQSDLIAAAKRAYEHAYAPYSNFRVGAAVLLKSGEVFSGCNVENASYGLTNCAERTAIFSAVSALGSSKVKIQAVAVVNDRNVACSPCGACRQVISEFGPDADIFYIGPKGIQRSSMRDLLPNCFSSESLS